jgi:thioredoxin 1/putative thioredoxin
MQAGAMGRRELRAMVDPHMPRAEGALKPIEVAQLIMQGQCVAIDTRDVAAFGRAHIPRATHMPLEEIEGRLAELYMVGGAPVLYCRSGDKTKELAAKLAAQGVEVSFIEGGFLGWEAEALPIERP